MTYFWVLLVIGLIVWLIGLKAMWGPFNGLLYVGGGVIVLFFGWYALVGAYNHALAPTAGSLRSWASENESTDQSERSTRVVPQEAISYTVIHVAGGQDAPYQGSVTVSEGQELQLVGKFSVDGQLYEWTIQRFPEGKTYRVTVEDGTGMVVSSGGGAQTNWCELIRTNLPETVGPSPYSCSQS